MDDIAEVAKSIIPVFLERQQRNEVNLRDLKYYLEEFIQNPEISSKFSTLSDLQKPELSPNPSQFTSLSAGEGLRSAAAVSANP